MKIAELAKTFQKKGVIYDFVTRKKDVAIYSLKYGDTMPIIGYDVVKVQSYSGESLNLAFSRYTTAQNGNYDEGCMYERYPSSEMWGSKGWSYNTIGAATKKFNELLDDDNANN